MRARREVPQNLRGTFLAARGNLSNSLRITSLADHHSLTPIESHPYQKRRGAGYLLSPWPGIHALHTGLSCTLPALSFQQVNYPTRIGHPEPSEGSLCVSLSFQQLTAIKFCNSFVLITIRIAGDGGSPQSLYVPTSQPCLRWATPSRHLLFSSTYELPNLQPPCFDNVTTVPRGVGSPLPYLNLRWRRKACLR